LALFDPFNMNFRSTGQVSKTKANPESTKFGKHEKGPDFLYHPLFFRAFLLSCFREKGFLLYSGDFISLLL